MRLSRLAANLTPHPQGTDGGNLPPWLNVRLGPVVWLSGWRLILFTACPPC